MKKPLLVLFEGLDRSGKTSIIDNLIKEKKIYREIGLVAKFKEPNSFIKNLVVNDNELCKFFDTFEMEQMEMDLARYHLVMAYRSHAATKYFKTMSKGYSILLDRSFPSTIVYQQKVCSMIDVLGINRTIFDYCSNYYGFGSFKIDLFVLVNTDYKDYVKRSKQTGESKYIMSEHKFLEKQNDYYFIYDNCDNYVNNKIMITNNDLNESTDRIYNRILEITNK